MKWEISRKMKIVRPARRKSWNRLPSAFEETFEETAKRSTTRDNNNVKDYYVSLDDSTSSEVEV